MEDFKVGDVIYFAKSDSAHVLEHVAKLNEESLKSLERNVLISKDVITIHKIPQANGEMAYQAMPGFGIISSLSVLTNDISGNLIININNFDIMGKVSNSEIIKLFENATSSILKPPKKSIIS